MGHLTRNETRYHNKDKKDENYEYEELDCNNHKGDNEDDHDDVYLETGQVGEGVLLDGAESIVVQMQLDQLAQVGQLGPVQL